MSARTEQLQQFYQDGDMFRERVVAKLLVGSAGSPMEAGRLSRASGPVVEVTDGPCG